MDKVIPIESTSERVARFLDWAESGWKEFEDSYPGISDDPSQITDDQFDYIIELPQLNYVMESLQQMYDNGELDGTQTDRFKILLETQKRLGAQLERVLAS